MYILWCLMSFMMIFIHVNDSRNHHIIITIIIIFIFEHWASSVIWKVQCIYNLQLERKKKSLKHDFPFTIHYYYSLFAIFATLYSPSPVTGKNLKLPCSESHNAQYLWKYLYLNPNYPADCYLCENAKTYMNKRIHFCIHNKYFRYSILHTPFMTKNIFAIYNLCIGITLNLSLVQCIII